MDFFSIQKYAKFLPTASFPIYGNIDGALLLAHLLRLKKSTSLIFIKKPALQ